MSTTTIIDTGPLVSYLDRRENNHLRIKKQFKELKVPLLTCEPVIVETCFILGNLSPAIQELGNWIGKGILKIDFSLHYNHDRVFPLMKKYRNLPMSLADACLVSIYESSENSRIFTLDHHFEIYRTPSRRIIRTIGLEK